MKNREPGRKIRGIGNKLFFLLIAAFLLAVWVKSPVYQSGSAIMSYYMPTILWHSDTDNYTSSGLPSIFPYDGGGTSVIRGTIPDSCPSVFNVLWFRASQQSVRIWLDGELLLEQGTEPKPRYLGKAPGSSWIIVNLPGDFAGKELTIELSSPYSNTKGLLNTVYLGTRNGLFQFVVSNYGGGLIISVVLIVLSIILILLYLIFLSKKINGKQALYIGLAGLFAGIWMLGECRMLQFIVHRLIAWYQLTMLSFHLLPLPLLYFVENLPDFPYVRSCRCARQITRCYLLILLLLQISGIRDFMEMLDVSLVILISMCIVFPVLIYYDFFHNKNRQILPVAAATTVLSITSVLELVSHLVWLSTTLGKFLRVGVLAFFLIISVSYLRQAIRIYTEGIRSPYYKEMSYRDQMTGCLNRRAYTEFEDEWKPGEAVGMLVADLNNLKTINDTMGHHAGDTYITTCAGILKETFHQKGSCYRMGGDEFLFIGKKLSENELSVLERRFSEAVREKCSSLSPLCSVATGTAVWEPEDLSLEDTMRRADQRMYQNKRKLKS